MEKINNLVAQPCIGAVQYLLQCAAALACDLDKVTACVRSIPAGHLLYTGVNPVAALGTTLRKLCSRYQRSSSDPQAELHVLNPGTSQR